MAKKNITIDVIDKEYDDTYIPATPLYDSNNVGNGSFGAALYSANVGQAGCGIGANSNPAKYNISSANGVPISGNIKPWSYMSTMPPGAGFCTLIYRDTALPFTSGGKLNFPGTPANPNAGVEYVKDFDFTGNHNANNNNGWMNSGGFPVALYWPSGSARGVQFYGAAAPIGNNQAWFGSYSTCTNVGFGIFNPTSAAPPEFTNISNAYSYLRLGLGIPDSCGATGKYSYAGLWQNIQGLTAGVEYTLKIKLAGADVLGKSYTSFGISPTTHNGINYVTLGGANASMYGSGPGSIYGGQSTNVPTYSGELKNNTPFEQVFTFTSVGGNEVLAIDVMSENVSGSPSQNITIDYCSIQEVPSTQIANWSGAYTRVNINNSNTGNPAGIAEIRLNIDAIDTSITGDAVIIGASNFQGGTIPGAVGLNNLLQPQITASNNPLLNPTHPLSLGMNTFMKFTQLSPSSGSFGPDDRLLEMQVINSSGNNIIMDSLDVRYVSFTSPVTSQTINYDKSVVGTLDVSESEDFPLDISYTISDGKNLESRFGDYSKSFDLPATKNNNKVFNNIWKANVDQTDKKTYGIKDCRINVDGIPFFEGSIQVKKSVHAGSAKSYSCTVYGGNFSWMSLLKDKGLCETFDELDTFPFDYASIEGTWTQNQSTTDIQYPLISWRDFNMNGLQNYINTYDVSAPPDFQAAFYVYNILKKIFDNIGYKLDSNFFETANFKRLLNTFPFLKNDAQDDRVFFTCTQQRQDGDYQYTNNHVGLNTPAVAGPDSGWFTCILNHNVSDPSLSYNNTTGVWTCQREGNYDIYAEMGFEIYNTSDNYCGGFVSGNCVWEYTVANPDDSWTWASRVKVTAGGTVIHQPSTNGFGQSSGDPLNPYAPYYISCWDGAKQYLTVPSFSVSLLVGDTIELQGRHIGQHLGLGSCEPKVTTSFGFDATSASIGNRQPRMTITFNDATPNIGGNIEKNNILPCGTSQVDYIKSIAHLFNLYFTTDVSSKTVYVEPFNDFYKSKSEGVDWTTKVDFSKNISDDYDIGLKSDLRIGYVKDGGDKYMENLNYKSNIYGDTVRLYDYNETLGDDFESGTLEMINPLFAASTQVWDNDAHDDSTVSKAPILIPNAWTEDCYNGIGLGNSQYRPDKLIEGVKPRIFYYCWENPVSFTTIANGFVANAGGTQTYWSRIFPSGSPFANQTVYPRATFVDWEERVHNQTMRPSLSFNDESFIAPGQFTENIVPGLYTVYYKNMIEQLKEAPRIRTVYINLKIQDILSLDMRKLVYLDETWWRINKIDGYNPAKNQTTKVELIQWMDVGFYPIYKNGIKIEY
jgi:hypothetical protein